MFKLGLVINPIAGVGGSVALKGSDGEGIAEKALSLGAIAKANQRTQIALEVLLPYKDNITIFTANNLMGEHCAITLGFTVNIVYQTDSDKTTASDTQKAVSALIHSKVDLMLFAGGDGTARDICQLVNDSLANHFPVLGIPAGCKIHSGVYAITPKAAGRVAEMIITNQLVTLSQADVMDIDEGLFRSGIVKAKRYGEMQIPRELSYIQAVKSGGKESDELVLQDIAADVIDKMDDELFIIGSGSTTAFLMEELSLDNTLLGVDVIHQQLLIASDVTEQALWNLLVDANSNNIPVKLVITLIGGQGHIFGRGNQQFTPEIIKRIGRDNLLLVATKEKINGLQGQPLLVDTNDPVLDEDLLGMYTAVTGFNEKIMYPVGVKT